jgi:hypothetical protein
MLALELPEHSGQHVLRNAGGGARAKESGVLAVQRGQFLLREGCQFRDFGSALLEYPASGSQHHPPTGSVEQARAELIFQRFNLLRYSRLAQAQFFCRSAETQVFADRPKYFQPKVFHFIVPLVALNPTAIARPANCD